MRKQNLITLISAAAGTLACVANAEDLQRTALQVDGYATPHGYVYINQSTGERIVSYQNAQPSISLRGTAAWTWNNSIIDGCAPSQDDPLQVAIFIGVMNEDAGDLGTADAVNYWQDWFEHPGNTIITGFTFGYFSQYPDPDEDGVEGCEFIMVFTENDSLTNRSTAIAHSPIIIGDLMGAEDDGADGGLNADGDPILAGDGVIDFAEGNYWTVYVDFSGCNSCDGMCDESGLEVGDTNGVYDGTGENGIFSGIPGVDTDGDGLINSGFVIGFRQPGVAEGDGLIDRFPELAGTGIENPDGYDPATFANIRPFGVPLVGPSANTESYDRTPESNSEWPLNPAYIPTFGEAVGSTDAFAFMNAEGVDTGVFFFGGFACDLAAVVAPFYQNPWSTPDIRFNIEIESNIVGHPADLVEPFDVLDLADVAAFVAGFNAHDCIADLAPPEGTLDLADINLFIASFLGGSP